MYVGNMFNKIYDSPHILEGTLLVPVSRRVSLEYRNVYGATEQLLATRYVPVLAGDLSRTMNHTFC